jgi:hypothetical protein
VSTEENEEIRRLRAENRRLREDVAILKAATTFFVGELDPRNADGRLHRRAARPAAAWVSGVRAGFRTPRILSVSQRSQPLHRVPFGPAVGEGDMAELGVRRSIVAVLLEQAASAAMPLIGGGVRQDRP